MKRFLNTLFQKIGEDKFIELRCIPLNQGQGAPIQYFFAKGEIDSLVSMAEALDKSKSYHICIGVLPRNQRSSGGADNVSCLQTLWIDVDAKNVSLNELYAAIEKFEVEPSIIVSSGHGYHCYWLLNEAHNMNKDQIKEIASKLHKATNADKTFDASRVLRLPGTTNYKNMAQPELCRVLKNTGKLYALQDITSWVDKVLEVQAAAREVKDSIPSPKIKNVGGVMEEFYSFSTWNELKNLLPPFVTRRIMELPLHLRDEHGEKLDRSKNDFYVATSLLELGFSPAQVLLAFQLFEQHGFAAGTKLKEMGSKYLTEYTIPNAQKQVPYNIHQCMAMMEDTSDLLEAEEFTEAALRIVKNTRAEHFLPKLLNLYTRCGIGSKDQFTILAKHTISGKGAYEFEEFAGVARKPTIMYKKIAEMIVKDHPYICIGSEPYRYDGGVYTPDAGLQILSSHIWAITENRPVGSRIGLEYGGLSDRTWLDLKQKDVQEITNYVVQNAIQYDLTSPLIEPDFICVKNGMVNWKTKELVPHSPKYFRLARLDVEFNPQATSPILETFMAETFNGDALNTIWEYMGVSILESVSAKRFMIFVGSGDNGKSVWLNVVRKVLGADNVSSATLKDLSENRFAKAQLLGKLANIASDISGEELEDIASIKELTGNDQTSADRKFQSQVNFVNKASLMFSCNVLPMAVAADDAYFKRLLIIDCPNQVPEEKQDKYLEAKLTTEESKSCWLNLALEGLSRYHSNGQIFSKSHTITEAVEAHKRECRPDITFVERYITAKPGHVLTIDNIIKEMREWMLVTSFATLPTKTTVKNLMAKYHPKAIMSFKAAGTPGYNDLAIDKDQIKKDLGLDDYLEIRLKTKN